MPQPFGYPQIILVVDDDALIREALRRQLRGAGYFMEAAESGAQALEFAEWARADLVILDLKMPGLDGFETCKRLKGMQGWEQVPVLILTGGQDDASYEEALAAGAEDFLKKPVAPQELLLRIHSLLRIQRILADLRESVATIEAQQEVILRDKALREKLQAFLLHDLKNPIASILLQAEMMVASQEEGTEAGLAWGRTLHHTERLLKLVTGWLDFMRSEAVGLHPRLVTVAPRAFLEDLLARHAIWFQVRRLEGSVQVQEGLSELVLDPTIMERVLGNLLENCIRYSPEGGAILLAARLPEAAQVRLEVSDRGPGIPRSQQQSIFDMYIQLEAASNQVGARESRGLGLAFCRMAAEAHGGKIWAEDNPEGGTRFVIELPMRG